MDTRGFIGLGGIFFVAKALEQYLERWRSVGV
jgi:hypothetical protein